MAGTDFGFGGFSGFGGAGGAGFGAPATGAGVGFGAPAGGNAFGGAAGGGFNTDWSASFGAQNPAGNAAANGGTNFGAGLGADFGAANFSFGGAGAGTAANTGFNPAATGFGAGAAGFGAGLGTGGFGDLFGSSTGAGTGGAGGPSFGFDMSAGGGFGAGNLFGAPATYSTGAAGAAGVVDEDNPDRRYDALVAAYDVKNPACRFKFMFYNKVNPAEIHKYKAPPNANQRLWAQAIQNNPDPKNLVPTQITGFDDLVKRMKQQNIASTEYQNKLIEIRNLLVEMSHRHDLVRKQEIERVRTVLTDLSHRLLKAMSKIEADRARDFPLLNTEVDFRRQLESIKRRLAKPLARVTELAVAVKQVEDRTGAGAGAAADTAAATAAAGAGAGAAAASGSAAAAAVLGVDNAERLFGFLDTQRTALAYLMATVKNDLKDVQVVADGLAKPK